MNQMSCMWLIGALLSGTSGVAGGDDIAPQPVSGPISWLYRYDEGKRLARETGKPIFVVFRCER